jgi:hypothetical protein
MKDPTLAQLRGKAPLPHAKAGSVKTPLRIYLEDNQSEILQALADKQYDMETLRLHANRLIGADYTMAALRSAWERTKADAQSRLKLHDRRGPELLPPPAFSGPAVPSGKTLIIAKKRPE